MSNFLHMGGYASYVWSSYLIALMVVVINWRQVRREERRVWDRLNRRSEFENYADGDQRETP